MKSGDLFKNRLLQEFVNNKETLLTYDELIEKATTIFGEAPQNISPINIFDFDRIIEIENDGILEKNNCW